jgi:hypothetical protein
MTLLSACGNATVLIGESGRSCNVEAGTTTQELFDACGLPEGFRQQPKLQQGFIFTKTCSAPAFRYGDQVVALGCDGTVAFVEPAEPFWRTLAEAGADDLILELSGTNAAAAAIELTRISLSEKQKGAAIAKLREAESGPPSTLRRAAELALRSISQK